MTMTSSSERLTRTCLSVVVVVKGIRTNTIHNMRRYFVSGMSRLKGTYCSHISCLIVACNIPLTPTYLQDPKVGMLRKVQTHLPEITF